MPIISIDDFAPPHEEAGVGLALRHEDGHYLFFVAGSRFQCPPGELFYAGIGGHREPGETWLACAHREAVEEIGADVEIISAASTWLLTATGEAATTIEVRDTPRPFALYEMRHLPGAPRAGQIYRLVIFAAQLRSQPATPAPDEVRAILALKPEQVARGLERAVTLEELLREGASLIVAADPIDPQTLLYPIGTARLLAQAFHQTATLDN